MGERDSVDQFRKSGAHNSKKVVKVENSRSDFPVRGNIEESRGAVSQHTEEKERMRLIFKAASRLQDIGAWKEGK